MDVPCARCCPSDNLFGLPPLTSPVNLDVADHHLSHHHLLSLLWNCRVFLCVFCWFDGVGVHDWFHVHHQPVDLLLTQKKINSALPNWTLSANKRKIKTDKETKRKKKRWKQRNNCSKRVNSFAIPMWCERGINARIDHATHRLLTVGVHVVIGSTSLMLHRPRLVSFWSLTLFGFWSGLRPPWPLLSPACTD